MTYRHILNIHLRLLKANPNFFKPDIVQNFKTHALNSPKKEIICTSSLLTGFSHCFLRTNKQSSLHIFKSSQEHIAKFLYRLGEKVYLASRIFVLQFNIYAFQRLRKSSKIYNFYQKLYSEQIKHMKAKLLSFRKPFGLLMAACVINSEISDEELDNYITETVQADDANACSKYQRICHTSLASRLKEEGWESVIEQNNFFVLRKSINCSCYEYKVFGTFQDIPPRIFYDVQLDTEYRKRWDSLVVKLEVIDQTDNGTEVIHWVMHYPFPMCKREYIFLRKSKIDMDSNVMVLVNKAVDHPSMPMKNNFVRVQDYYSKMVIKPHRGLDDMGFDYILTYYDDPQAPFPSTAYNWMACYGVPEFVCKLHKAALDLYNSKKCQPAQNVLPASGANQYAYA